jgi:hypothetical protein
VAAPVKSPPTTPSGVQRTAPGVSSAGEPGSRSFLHHAVTAGTPLRTQQAQVACVEEVCARLGHTLEPCCASPCHPGRRGRAAVDQAVTVLNYTGEPGCGREEHARGVLGLPAWHKTSALSPLICAMLPPGRTTPISAEQNSATIWDETAQFLPRKSDDWSCTCWLRILFRDFPHAA